MYAIVYGDFSVGVHGKHFSMLLDKRESGISSIIYNGTEYITGAPKISFWRAMTDNDTGAGYQQLSHKLIDADFDKLMLEIIVDLSDGFFLWKRLE